MSYRISQLMAVVVSLVVGAWTMAATVALLERIGAGPPASVLVAMVLGPLTAALVYALLHDGPRAVPLLLRVRDRRGRR